MSSLHCLQNVFFSWDETIIIAESMHVVQAPSIGEFGGWWIWFPQEKVCIVSGKNFVKIQMASQDWCLEGWISEIFL